jgi:hypothetical protein
VEKKIDVEPSRPEDAMVVSIDLESEAKRKPGTQGALEGEDPTRESGAAAASDAGTGFARDPEPAPDEVFEPEGDEGASEGAGKTE